MSSTAVGMEICHFCGMHHGGRCPSVQAIEYHPDGSIKRVEFVKPAIPLPGVPTIPWDWSRPFPPQHVVPTD